MSIDKIKELLKESSMDRPEKMIKDDIEKILNEIHFSDKIKDKKAMYDFICNECSKKKEREK